MLLYDTASSGEITSGSHRVRHFLGNIELESVQNFSNAKAIPNLFFNYLDSRPYNFVGERGNSANCPIAQWMDSRIAGPIRERFRQQTYFRLDELAINVNVTKCLVSMSIRSSHHPDSDDLERYIVHMDIGIPSEWMREFIHRVDAPLKEKWAAHVTSENYFPSLDWKDYLVPSTNGDTEPYDKRISVEEAKKILFEVVRDNFMTYDPATLSSVPTYEFSSGELAPV